VFSQAATVIEADTRYLWKMKGNLAIAVAAGDKESVSEYREALLMLISVTESKHVRMTAWRALAAAETVAIAGPSDNVRPFIRKVLPATSAALAVVVAACGLAATPSMTDPPMDLPFEVAAVVIEQPSCEAWIDSCE
jgi:hypothetical protein